MQNRAANALRVALSLVVLLGFSPAAGQARDRYWGADHRLPGGLGGYEGSVASRHFHGSSGYFGFPNHWTEGHGPSSDHGHSGDVLRYGREATSPGHWQAGYQASHAFYRGAYDALNTRLFHFQGEWDGRE